MSQNRKFIILGFAFVIALILNISLGSVIIPFKDLWTTIIHPDNETVYNQIIWDYRLPKLLTAILSGIALGISGLLMQTLFKNPIVGPYVLGMSSGAGLLVALLIFGTSLLGVNLTNPLALTTAAALGSVLTLGLILGFYYKLKNASSLLIVGIMMGIFSGAIISILSYFSQAETLQKYVFWAMGSLGNIGFGQLLLFFVIVIVFSFASILFSKKLNALLLGENYAISLGVSLKQTHLFIIIIAGILAGTVTAMVGPIAFVGLMVPHIARMFFKTQMHQILLPGVILIGSILMLFFDTLAQLPDSNYTIPMNSVTALFGAPLVVFMIFNFSKKKR